jgi:4-hydroxy-tetrahydrodipicolinate synthase
MIEYYKSVCNAVPKDFPVYAYAIPQLAHNELTPQVMEKICNTCPNLVGVKYSYPDFRTLMAYLEVNGGKFSVVFGADDMFMPALCAGADGVVSGCSGPFPEPFVKIYKEYCEGNLEAARISQKKANEIIFLMKAGADMSIFKNILNWRGIPAGHMRAPLMDISKETADDLYNMMKKYITEYQ